MDVTLDYWLTKINDAQDKGTLKIRNMISNVNKEVSLLRLTALKNGGTEVAFHCGRKANNIEKLLRFAMDGTLVSGDIVPSTVTVGK